MLGANIKKTIGIIGGMGPDASCYLYNRINKLTPVNNDQDHLHIIIDSNSQIPDRTDYLINGLESPLPYLIKSAKTLEAAGVDAVAIACNTSHYFEEQIKKEINVTFISIIDAVAKKLLQKNLKKVAVFCTWGTMQAKIYDKTLNNVGIEVAYPDNNNQKLVTKLIYEYVKKGKSLEGSAIKLEVETLMVNLKKQGATAFVLACTELPIAFCQLGINDDSIIDSTHELAKAIINFAIN